MVLWEYWKKFWHHLFQKEKSGIPSSTTTISDASIKNSKNKSDFIDEMKDKMALNNASKIETPVCVGDGMGILHHYEYE